MQSKFYDSLETRDPLVREQVLFAALPAHLKQAASQSSFLRSQLDGIDIESLTTRQALSAIPVVRKSELLELQSASPPFGGLTAFDPTQLVRIYASPGPIYEPQTTREDYWRLSRALYAAGLRKGMLVHNAFS